MTLPDPMRRGVGWLLFDEDLTHAAGVVNRGGSPIYLQGEVTTHEGRLCVALTVASEPQAEENRARSKRNRGANAPEKPSQERGAASHGIRQRGKSNDTAT